MTETEVQQLIRSVSPREKRNRAERAGPELLKRESQDLDRSKRLQNYHFE